VGKGVLDGARVVVLATSELLLLGGAVDPAGVWAAIAPTPVLLVLLERFELPSLAPPSRRDGSPHANPVQMAPVSAHSVASRIVTPSMRVLTYAAAAAATTGEWSIFIFSAAFFLQMA
jgi:hypothetical protein